jgi:hypothetical protein
MEKIISPLRINSISPLGCGFKIELVIALKPQCPFLSPIFPPLSDNLRPPLQISILHIGGLYLHTKSREVITRPT